ncbi:hypothetical protein [Microcoleus sp. PH2017_16_JOR_D_A]|nr:hypothetical protein [Microcoleus sp. PH2017_16_JOR_D_A]
MGYHDYPILTGILFVRESLIAVSPKKATVGKGKMAIAIGNA